MNTSSSEPILSQSEKYDYLEKNLNELSKLPSNKKLQVDRHLLSIDLRFGQWIRRWVWGDSFYSTISSLDNNFTWYQEAILDQDKKIVEKFKNLLKPACIGLDNLTKTYEGRKDLSKLEVVCKKFKEMLEEKEVLSLAKILEDKEVSPSEKTFEQLLLERRKTLCSVTTREIKQLQQTLQKEETKKTGFVISQNDLNRPLNKVKQPESNPKFIEPKSKERSDFEKILQRRRSHIECKEPKEKISRDLIKEIYANPFKIENEKKDAVNPPKLESIQTPPINKERGALLVSLRGSLDLKKVSDDKKVSSFKRLTLTERTEKNDLFLTVQEKIKQWDKVNFGK